MQPPFIPEQFKRRPGDAKVEKDLKLWLLGLSIEERVEFIKRLWSVHFRLALILVQSLQLPVNAVEELLKHLLLLGKHNTSSEMIKRFVPVLGERKFWRVAAELELLPAMRDFLNYHSHGRLDAELAKRAQPKIPADASGPA